MLEIKPEKMEITQGETDLNSQEIKAASLPSPKKRRRLKVAHPERCIGCLGCMFACSRTRTGTVSLQNSAIKVQTQGGIEGDFRVIVCRGCADAPCARACPTGALEKKPDGRVLFHKSYAPAALTARRPAWLGPSPSARRKFPSNAYTAVPVWTSARMACSSWRSFPRRMKCCERFCTSICLKKNPGWRRGRSSSRNGWAALASELSCSRRSARQAPTPLARLPHHPLHRPPERHLSRGHQDRGHLQVAPYRRTGRILCRRQALSGAALRRA